MREAVVCRNVVSMHSRPDMASEVVSQALWGEHVGVLAVAQDAALVQTPDGYRGWVPCDAVACLPAPTCVRQQGDTEVTNTNPSGGAAERGPSPAGWGPRDERVVGELFAPLLAEPRDDARRITLLTVGARVATASEPDDDGYAPIIVPTGGIGHIETRHLTTPPRVNLPVSPDVLVASALRFMGIPYLWGGRSSFGMDCSGFVQMVYGLHGVVLPRDACMQAAWPACKPIERANLRPGDLVFFGGDYDPRGRGITHVGMALEPPEFIHAAGGIGVTVSSLEEEPYRGMFRCAARP